MSSSLRFAAVALAAGVGLGASGALADGYEAGGSVKDAPVAGVVYDWSGVYFGGHAGWGWGDIDTDLEKTDPWWVKYALKHKGVPLENSQEVDGWLAGGHLGLQHQFGRWVLGLEASATWGDLEGSSSGSFEKGYWKTDASVDTKISDLFTVTGRIGHAWDRWLGYVKGGYASGKVEVNAAAHGEKYENEYEKDFDFSSSSSERHHGWTIGAGLEYMVRPDLILGLEYNYIDLGSKTHNGKGVYEMWCPDDVNTKMSVDPDAIHAVYARLSLKLGRQADASAPLK